MSKDKMKITPELISSVDRLEKSIRLLQNVIKGGPGSGRYPAGSGGNEPTEEETKKAAKFYAEAFDDANKISRASSDYITGNDTSSDGSEIQNVHIEAAKTLIHAIRSSPESDIPLYRSVFFYKKNLELRDKLLNAEPGHTINIDRISSFSEAKGVASFYGVESELMTNIMIVVEGPSKSVATDKFTRKRHKERITQGKFEVVRVEGESNVEVQRGYRSEAGRKSTVYKRTVVIRQIGVF